MRFIELYSRCGFSFTTTITLAMLTNQYQVKFIPINYHRRVGKSSIKPLRDFTRISTILIIRICAYFKPLNVFVPPGAAADFARGDQGRRSITITRRASGFIWNCPCLDRGANAFHWAACRLDRSPDEALISPPHAPNASPSLLRPSSLFRSASGRRDPRRRGLDPKVRQVCRSGAPLCIVFLTNGDRNPWPQRVMERSLFLDAKARRRWGMRRQGEARSALDMLGAGGSAEVHFIAWPDQGVTELL